MLLGPSGACKQLRCQLYLNLGCLISSALRNCAPLLYQLFSTIVKQSVKQLHSDLMQTFCFSSCNLHHLLFLLSPLMYPVQWLILLGKVSFVLAYDMSACRLFQNITD